MSKNGKLLTRLLKRSINIQFEIRIILPSKKDNMKDTCNTQTFHAEIESLASQRITVEPLCIEEYGRRLRAATEIMQQNEVAAVYLSASSNLFYFTGTRWSLSERMAGAVLSADGKLVYIAPAFERATFLQHSGVDAEIRTWEEDESPYRLFIRVLEELSIHDGCIGIDESTPYCHFGEIASVGVGYRWIDARPVTAGCRSFKSEDELRLIRAAMHMTLKVQMAARNILQEGISTVAVGSFIDDAHRVIGSDSGSTFCAVQFGEATAYPHGVPYPQTLKKGDLVLIDTGCKLHGYNSDITRTYAFGDSTSKQRSVWNTEKEAQKIAFDTAQIGVRCGDVDKATRDFIHRCGYGPGYKTPGLPHRTGHGIGLDIHEWPYLVKNDDTALAEGMCFSNEPMLCIDGEFGVRLEDHFFMRSDGPRWFTQPAYSIDEPFGRAT